MLSAATLVALATGLVATAADGTLRNVVYFMEWGIYDQNFPIFKLDWSRITHINYAFGKPAADGTVGMFDSWAATDEHYADDSEEDPNIVAGQFGRANKMKRMYRNTKFGLSIGGWTLSDQFSNIFSTAAGRQRFVDSSVKLMLDLGLDFIDIDWEYPVEGGNDSPPVPHRPEDIQNFVLVLQAFRSAFAKLPFKAELSVASPAGPANYRHWDFKSICGLLDHINIMTYDLAGSWSAYTDHLANLYEDPNHPPGAKYSVHGAIQDYIKGGCPSDKIVMGIPLYGVSFEHSTGLYSNFTQPTKGSWKGGEGQWDYKVLPLAGATEGFDAKLGAAYSYDPKAQTFTSYDSPESMAMKLDYIKKYNLGGTMFWAGDSDAPAGGSRSLITQAYNAFGKEHMAFWENNINYPTSKYSNIRNGSTPTPTSSGPTTVTPQPTSKTPAPSTKTPSPSTKTPAPTSSSPVPTTTPQPTPSPTPTTDVCEGHHNVCFWPLTHQVLNYGQADCKLFSSFVWCP
ncbi:glycoside hydrolase family 18 protein [Achlya hypogyna]|uniref:Glycoside hydrolase family 18 protein n=1 Tax=Achlya hypogyna TaxID=1202772 RepID=A0A0A7CNL1_ACHHY|nr:secreted protein [Achlya hypogyna]OQR90984.1 glycoside hydrolase family 18 protein [Achlya hypogyna]